MRSPQVDVEDSQYLQTICVRPPAHALIVDNVDKVTTAMIKRVAGGDRSRPLYNLAWYQILDRLFRGQSAGSDSEDELVVGSRQVGSKRTGSGETGSCSRVLE